MNTNQKRKAESGKRKASFCPLSAIRYPLFFLWLLALPLAAQTPTSGLTSASALATGDLIKVVDISDTTAAATGTDKKATLSLLTTFLQGYMQPLDADLTTYAGITPSANVQALLGAADYAAIRTQLALVIGTNVQAYDADLTTYAGITPSANVQSVLGAANYAAIKTLLSLNNVENTALSTWTGATSITTLGTIATGTWSATAIGTSKGGAPSGGTTGQVLTKSSNTSYDYAWAAASGGSSTSDPNVAYVRSDGNDTTGTIGNPALPYLTAQAAIDDGATVLDLGVGSFGAITVPDADILYFCGKGQTKTSLGNITTSTNATLYDYGKRSFTAATVTIAPATTLTLVGVMVIDTASGDGSGSDNAGSLTLDDGAIVVGAVSLTGDSGNGGVLTMSQSWAVDAVTVASTSGTPGTISLTRGAAINGALTPDAATVSGSFIGGVFYSSTYP